MTLCWPLNGLLSVVFVKMPEENVLMWRSALLDLEVLTVLVALT